MCANGCIYADRWGGCTKPSREPCPEESDDGYEYLDYIADDLYEEKIDREMMNTPRGC